MSYPLILHVNYVEQGQSIDDMCRLAVRWGYDGIEFRRKRTGVPESVDGYLDAIAASRDKHGLRQVMFGGPGPDLMQADAVQRERVLDECAAFYRAAASRFELSVCNILTGEVQNPACPRHVFERHGSQASTPDQQQAVVQGLRMLGGVAAGLGFRLAFETHMVYLHDLPEPTRKLVDEIESPAVGINFDYGNIGAMNGAPSLQDAMAICGDRIYMVHLKNFFRVPGTTHQNTIRCGLADGEINHREYLRRLRAMGFAGPLVIEAPRPGDREWFAMEDLRYIRALLDEID